MEFSKQLVSVITTILVNLGPLTHLRGYGSKLLSVQEQAWERHGVQDWLELPKTAVMHF